MSNFIFAGKRRADSPAKKNDGGLAGKNADSPAGKKRKRKEVDSSCDSPGEGWNAVNKVGNNVHVDSDDGKTTSDKEDSWGGN